MDLQQVRILDDSARPVATATVKCEAGQWEGTVSLAPMPAPMRQLFADFEEIAEGQMLSFLDDIEGRIASLNLRAAFPDGPDAAFARLHIYPTTGAIFFTLAKSPAFA